MSSSIMASVDVLWPLTIISAFDIWLLLLPLQCCVRVMNHLIVYWCPESVPLTHISHLRATFSLFSCVCLTENDLDVHVVSLIRDPSSLKIDCILRSIDCILFALIFKHVRSETIVWVNIFVDRLTCMFIKLNLKSRHTHKVYLAF